MNIIILQGEKKREQTSGGGGVAGTSSAPERNEIVACTSCAGDGTPCTHTASNNGCATEVISLFYSPTMLICLLASNVAADVLIHFILYILLNI